MVVGEGSEWQKSPEIICYGFEFDIELMANNQEEEDDEPADELFCSLWWCQSLVRSVGNVDDDGDNDDEAITQKKTDFHGYA